MIPLTISHSFRRGQLVMGGCGFEFSLMVDLVTAVGREADCFQAWGHFEQHLKEKSNTYIYYFVT
jgi:hypothetical protein